jgi:hypothetical protein
MYNRAPREPVSPALGSPVRQQADDAQADDDPTYPGPDFVHGSSSYTISLANSLLYCERVQIALFPLFMLRAS